MDYPHPRIKIAENGSLDLSDAYDTGIGAWDKVSVEFGYQDFPDGMDEVEALADILDKAFSSGLFYLTNQDAAPAGGAHPLSNDWDNGVHPVDELEHKMKVRQIALDNFSESKVRFGDSLATLGRGTGSYLSVPPLSDRSGSQRAGRPVLQSYGQGWCARRAEIGAWS